MEIAAGEVRFSEAYGSSDGNWARSVRNARTPKRRDNEDYDDRSPSVEKVTADVDARHHHLVCAARELPFRLMSPLAAFKEPLSERDELNAIMTRKIEREDNIVDPAAAAPATRDEYAGFLARAAEDDEVLLVFGDWLQSVGDARGQLIAVQHALETAKGPKQLGLQEAEKRVLSGSLLMPDAQPAAFLWRRGFVHRVMFDAIEHDKWKPVLRHPSLQLVREVAVSAALPALPATVRVLELGRLARRDDVAAILAGLPGLERLKLHFVDDLRAVRHGKVVELELFDLGAPRAGMTLRTADRDQLPSLRRLVLRIERGLDAAVALVCGTPLVRDLEELVLHGPITPAGLAPLREAKGRPRVLDLRGTPITTIDDSIRDLAATIAINEPKQVGPWLVRHTRRPEWGIGRVIAEGDDGIDVEFETAGRKLVRNVELLEEVEGSG